MDIYVLLFNRLGLRLIIYILLTLNFTLSLAQDAFLTLEKKQIRLHEQLALNLQFPDGSKREFKAFQNYTFPDIPDFAKENTLWGENEKGYFITQYYRPLSTGTFTINGFFIRLKKKTFAFKSTEVLVKPGKKNLQRPMPGGLTYTYKEADAFLEVKTSHKEVFQGQGLGLQVALMIAGDNEAEITFYQLARQRQEIIQKLKSRNCLAEENQQTLITVDSVIVKGKRYNRWMFCEVILFPTDSSNLVIPALGLDVLTYEQSKMDNGITRKTIPWRFSSAPQTIKIKSIGVLGTRNIPVGNFKLNESISTSKFKTGKSFTYTFIIAGEGNLSILPEPAIKAGEILDVYPPRITKEISIQKGRLFGTRSYTYYITPKEPGNFSLGDFIQFSYFNFEKKSMDTLYSKIPMKIKGESLKNTYISNNHPDDFYSSALSASNTLTPLNKEDKLAFYANILILMMLLITGVIVLRK